MNYYPFHLGDYAAHTAHLEPLEDLAYRRMLDAYYLRESPLPANPADIARLIRMRQNLTEVEAVLSEFFSLTPAGWSHIRCDEEIERMKEKQEANELRDSHEKDRMKRHRERRAEMFQSLRDVGIVPPWDVSMKELQRLHDENCNAPETHLKREQAISGASPATAIPTPTPTPTPTPIIKPTHTNARAPDGSVGWVENWEPDKKHLADQLGFRGVAMPSDAGLEQILYAFRAHYETKPMTDKQSMAKLVAWIQREHKPTNPDKPAGKTNRHAGFEDTDYSAGVLPDGRF